MAFEVQDMDFRVPSPGGFVIGVQGWNWADPVAKSITFFLDGSAMVGDQYGRPMIGVQTADGQRVLFATTPPDGSREGDVQPRPQYATHAQVLAALASEGINWLAYEVRYVGKDGRPHAIPNLTLEKATAHQTRLIKEENKAVAVMRAVACSGWPQIPYAELKKLPELPPTPLEELRKIRDPNMRRDALKARREVDEVRAREFQASEAE